jgi:hypothetical protein
MRYGILAGGVESAQATAGPKAHRTAIVRAIVGWRLIQDEVLADAAQRRSQQPIRSAHTPTGLAPRTTWWMEGMAAKEPPAGDAIGLPQRQLDELAEHVRNKGGFRCAAGERM